MIVRQEETVEQTTRKMQIASGIIMSNMSKCEWQFYYINQILVSE